MSPDAVLPMALMGLLVAAVAPTVVVLAADRWPLSRAALPARVVFPLFVVLHAVVTLTAADSMTDDRAQVLRRVIEGAVVLVGAVWFWLPVLGRHHRLSDPARCAYLFIAAPMLDLPAVWQVGGGDVTGGLAMIVGMLPLGVIAVVITWRWVRAEELSAGP